MELRSATTTKGITAVLVMALFGLFVAGAAFIHVATTHAPAPTLTAVLVASGNQPLLLDREEADWFEDHPVLRIGVDANRPPMEAYSPETGYSGLMADYVEMVVHRLPVDLELVPYTDFSEAMDRLRRGRLDVITGVIPTPERRRTLAFTDPILTAPYVVVTDSRRNVVSSVHDLEGATVAVERGYFIERRLAKDHPGIRRRAVTSTEVALELVDSGYADAYVGNLWVVSYFLQQAEFQRLVIVGVSGYDSRGC